MEANMDILYDRNDEYEIYSSYKNSIGQTFSNKKNIFLPYVRKYNKLSEEQLLQLIEEAKSNEWTALDLSDCGIEEIPDELWNVESLKVLYIGNIGENNGSNTFGFISEQICKLVNLEAFSICNVQNVKIPYSLKKLPRLVYLDCFGCQYDIIPNNLLNCRLKAIGIDCRDAVQLAEICKIRKIEEIYLTGSKLETLPPEIGSLKKLKKLIMNNSYISSIPDSMMNLLDLKLFRIYGTPLAEKVPQEILTQTARQIVYYICKQQKENGDCYFNESKMIVVGQGSVGKSCLVQRITENSYQEKESTEGIDVRTWTYNIRKKRYILNIWDFGGQEIYHSTHQFFLTKRSLYVFVWDARAEEEYGRIDYWLKTIESFASDSPIIIAVNKCDETVTRINRIDLKEYQQKYPMIKVILDISCKDNINIQRLRDLIKKEASNLPITKERWLKSWHEIRIQLEQEAKEKPYISLEQYIDICKKYLVEREEALSLSKYLHDLGIILHYQDDRFLKNIVILYPEWATNALYKILDNQEAVLQGRNGVLFLDDLPKIWADKNIYPEDKYIFLLKIMEKFDLCYSINDFTFLVAELLEQTSVDCPKDWNFDNSNCICINYKYEFMPAGIMTRFIVKIHECIASVNGKSLCWKKGVFLKNRTAYARVVMKDTISEKVIEVRVTKSHCSVDERELLFKIRESLKAINQTFYNLRVEEFVPCNCSPNCNYFFSYNTLCSAIEKKIQMIQCHSSFEQVNILDLLEGIEIMKSEEINPYSIRIENNPTITTTITSENSSTQNCVISFKEVKNQVLEMQGDLTELKEELLENKSQEALDIVEHLDKVNGDLETIGNMKTTEEVIKSGKLNKLKRFLINLSDESSQERKILSGIKNIATIMSGLFLKYNKLAEKLGVCQLPF